MQLIAIFLGQTYDKKIYALSLGFKNHSSISVFGGYSYNQTFLIVINNDELL